MSQGVAGIALDERTRPTGASRSSRSTAALMYELLREQRLVILVLWSSGILAGFLESAILAVLAEAAAAIATGAKRAHIHLLGLHLRPTVDKLFLVALGLILTRLLLQVPLSLLPPRVITRVQANMRRSTFYAFTHASWDVQARDREGQLQETMTGQVGQATAAVQSALGIVASTLLLAVLMLSAFALNAVAAGFVLVLTLALLALLRPVRKTGGRRASVLSGLQVEYARGVAESIRVAEEAHVFGAGEALRTRIWERIEVTRKQAFSTQIMLRLAGNLYSTFISLLFIATLFFLFEIGKSHAASLAAVVLILVRASSSGQNIQSSYQGLIQALPFLERVQEAERRYRESIPAEGDVALPRIESIAFEGVGYAYRAGWPVLSDVSFRAHGGEVIGVIGPSGAGKSTLVQLLLRLREPVEGSYLVNDTPAWEIAKADWHQRVAYVPQEPRLLHASVAENIRFFREIEDQEIERAGRLARIHEDIMSWSEGYQTIVGPRADAVSGGQQQRICLARALVGRPELLVLDEPTSALDPTSEALIQESLTGLKQEELTLFIVAHRMSTLNICDRVMIIIDGKLAGFDTIDSLQRHNAYYRSASRLATGGMLNELPSV